MGYVVTDFGPVSQLSRAVETPLLSICVDQVGECLKSLPLQSVTIPETLGTCPCSGRFEFDMADEKPIYGDAQVGTSINVIWQHLGAIGDSSVDVGSTDPFD